MSGVRRVFDWTPDRYTTLRKAWRAKPASQTTAAFDREQGMVFGINWRTVQRCRVSLGLKSTIGRNAKRSAATKDRNFGDRGDAVREMPCLAAKHCAAVYFNDLQECHAGGEPDAFDPDDHPSCLGDVQACHVLARGMGGAKGDRRELVPLCARHHEESGEGSWKPQQPSKRAAFETRYGLDLKDEAKRIAVDLDARGLP